MRVHFSPSQLSLCFDAPHPGRKSPTRLLQPHYFQSAYRIFSLYCAVNTVIATVSLFLFPSTQRVFSRQATIWSLHAFFFYLRALFSFVAVNFIPRTIWFVVWFVLSPSYVSHLSLVAHDQPSICVVAFLRTYWGYFIQHHQLLFRTAAWNTFLFLFMVSVYSEPFLVPQYAFMSHQRVSTINKFLRSHLRV